jgi:hypothetical protein
VEQAEEVAHDRQLLLGEGEVLVVLVVDILKLLFH